MRGKYFTNEKLGKLFESSCSLASFAIKTVRKLIENGQFEDINKAIDVIYQEALAVPQEDKKENGIL